MPAPDREITVLRTLETGLRNHRDGDLRIAADWYYSVLDIHPDQPDALHLLGLISYQSDDGPIAIKLIDRAIEIDPANAVFHVSRGDILVSMERIEDAVESYYEGISCDPSIPEAFNNCGSALNRLGRWSEAEGHLQRALQLRPDYATAHNNLGHVFRAQGRPEHAIACIETAIAHKPDEPAFHDHLGVALRDAGRPREAADCHERALGFDPQLADAHFNLGNARKDTGDLEGAASCYRKAVSLRTDFADAQLKLGEVLDEGGAHEAAIMAYRQTLMTRPDYAEAHNNLGNVLRALGRDDEALKHFREVLSLEPDHASARHMIDALTGRTTPAAPRAHIRALHDRFAAVFDTKIAAQSDYRVPMALKRAVLGHRRTGFRTGLDLGCGTGLSAAAFEGLVEDWDGIDLSPRMLHFAARKGLYRYLCEGDVTDVLQNMALPAETYDLVLAGDVFGHVGDISPVVKGLFPLMSGGGLFAFSAEPAPGGDYALRTNGRYAHNEAYVRSLAVTHGFDVASVETTTFKTELGRPVSGNIYVLRRACAPERKGR